jgi:anti-sigma regulatory factor (Ser/Thr protein kinase)
MTTRPAPTVAGERYRHEALFYATADDFVDQTVAFVRDAVTADEPVLVVLASAKNAQLAEALGADGDRVEFADMDAIGANPARIIPAWDDFLARHAGSGRRLRGIGEPISASRTGAELEECQRHEALLNVAFRDPEFWLLCPYDTSTLGADVLEDARRNHPYVRSGGKCAVSVPYPGPEAFSRPSCAPLPTAPAHAARLDFDGHCLARVRARVRAVADAGRLTLTRRADLVLAVHEVAANSIRHGGAAGLLLTWHDADRVVCEVRDRGENNSVPARYVSPDTIGYEDLDDNGS